MKIIYTCTSLLALSLFLLKVHAQTIDNGEDAAAFALELNDAAHPCITAQEYTLLEKQCAENIRLLGLSETTQRSTNSTSLTWPLQEANGLTDCDFALLSAGVDHNTVAGTIQDYNCGTNTYDAHGGNDLSIWPYNFYKMDNNQVEVIAAAAGTILYKSDGHFDKYCAANSDTANYIVIRHADGSQANYWHMKKNSVTSKAVGQTVVAGEHLGFVGSSGNSSGPHLHFEVWNGSTSATRIDPFAGPCNNLNAITWWASQKPYKKTAVVKVSVNTTDAVFPACPTTETPNESSSFSIPFQGPGLSPGYAKFYAFIAYDTIGVNVNLSILNPNGSVFNSWVYNSAVVTKTSTRAWSKLLPTTPGVYTFKAEHSGAICSTQFTVGNPSAIDDLQAKARFDMYPNPANSEVNITISEDMVGGMATLVDVTGRQLMSATLLSANSQLLTAALADGVYLLTLNHNGQAATRRLIISR